MRARSILDTTLWDLNTRLHNLQLHKYLGMIHLDEVPAYTSGGYYLDGNSSEMLGDEMACYVEKGFQAIKMKSERLSSKEEEVRVKPSARTSN